MRSQRVLLDAGPLVAILSPSDSQHHSCIDTLRIIDPPLLTCWPVLTEVAWLLRHDAAAIKRLFSRVHQVEFTILELTDNDLPAVNRLFGDYEDISPQLADLALLRLAQREKLDTVFTLDR